MVVISVCQCLAVFTPIIVALAAHTPTFAGEKNDAIPLQFTLQKMDAFKHSLHSWDDIKHPTLFACIQSEKEYDSVFFAFPPAGAPRLDGKPHDEPPPKPDASIFTKHTILVVYRVVSEHPDEKTPLQVEKVFQSGNSLAVHYRFEGTKPPPEDKDTCAFFAGASIVLPKGNYERVEFYENGLKSGKLEPKAGHWRIPSETEMATWNEAREGFHASHALLFDVERNQQDRATAKTDEEKMRVKENEANVLRKIDEMTESLRANALDAIADHETDFIEWLKSDDVEVVENALSKKRAAQELRQLLRRKTN